MALDAGKRLFQVWHTEGYPGEGRPWRGPVTRYEGRRSWYGLGGPEDRLLWAIHTAGAGFERGEEMLPEGRMERLQLGEDGAEAVGDRFTGFLCGISR